MAIALLRAVYHSRKIGHSAVRGAAYRSGERLTDERTGEVCDWTHRKTDVLFKKLVTPDHAPVNLQTSRAALWNAVEAAENRGDARVAYEIKLALPHELSLEQNIELASAYAAMLMQRHGQAVDLVIHKADEHGDTRNMHAHLMLSPRALEADGFAKKKLRAITDKVQGPKEIESWRQGWQDLANKALERAGHEARIDMRSYKRQGIDREGEIHLGPAASAMERRGIQTDKGDINREIKQRNEEREQAKIIDLQIEREKRAQEQKRREELAGRYTRTIEREKGELLAEQEQDRAALAKRHGQDRERLNRQQAERHRRDEAERQGRFRTGLFGLWDKFTGAHEQTGRRNDREREEQRRHDEAARQRQAEAQARERGDFAKWHREQRQQQAERHARYEQERQEILEHGQPQYLREAFAQEAAQRKEWEGQEQSQQRSQGMGRERSLGYER
jgi:hypothetical protein